VALDVGSSSVRAIAYDEHGRAEPGDARVVTATRDADELVAACRSVLAHVGEADTVAISCFWHSLLPVDEHERPLGRVLMWSDVAAGERPALDPVAYHARTGCFLHPSFWPMKVRGLRAARYLSFPDYLLLRLTGELRTSVSMASGTGLFDPNRRDWDDETLAAVGVDRAQLAPVADEPVAGVWPALGDGCCSNVGAGAITRERAAVTVGTSAAMRVLYDTERVEPRPGLFLYRVDEHRFCEGGALSDGGNLHAWLSRTLVPFDDGDLAERPAAAHGLVFLPFLGGERALGWNAERRGLVRGLTFGTTPIDIAQAAIEGICYRLADVYDAIGGIESIVATGGALFADRTGVQILADVLGRPVEVSAVPEGSARGAAIVVLGRLGVDVPPAPVEGVVEPRPGRHEIHVAARREHELTMQFDEEG
jgi:gluconokinase